MNPRLTSPEPFIQRNLEIGYARVEARSASLPTAASPETCAGHKQSGEFVSRASMRNVAQTRADMEEIKKEWLERTKYLKLEFREPIRLRDRT